MLRQRCGRKEKSDRGDNRKHPKGEKRWSVYVEDGDGRLDGDVVTETGPAGGFCTAQKA
jgi:hypothetical protein